MRQQAFADITPNSNIPNSIISADKVDYKLLTKKLYKVLSLYTIFTRSKDSSYQQLEDSFNKLSDQQQLTIINQINKNFGVLIGGPGTGKTTTSVQVLIINYVIKLLELQSQYFPSVALCAPTGKGSENLHASILRYVQDLSLCIKEYLSRQNQGTALELIFNILSQQELQSLLNALNGIKNATFCTIHKLLNLSPYKPLGLVGDYATIEYDFVVVDEIGMTQLDLVALLLKSTTPKTNLLLLGDKDQLPSIGIGYTLANISEQDSYNDYSLHSQNQFLEFGLDALVYNPQGKPAQDLTLQDKQLIPQSNSSIVKYASLQGFARSYRDYLQRLTQSQRYKNYFLISTYSLAINNDLTLSSLERFIKQQLVNQQVITTQQEFALEQLSNLSQKLRNQGFADDFKITHDLMLQTIVNSQGRNKQNQTKEVQFNSYQASYRFYELVYSLVNQQDLSHHFNKQLLEQTVLAANNLTGQMILNLQNSALTNNAHLSRKELNLDLITNFSSDDEVQEFV